MAGRPIASPYVAKGRDRRLLRKGRKKAGAGATDGGKKPKFVDPAAAVLAAEAQERDGLPFNVTIWNPRTSTEDELIVIKHIMVREALLEDMRRETQIVAMRKRPGVAQRIVQMLLQVRVATIEAVDHIEVWRRRFVRVTVLRHADRADGAKRAGLRAVWM